VQSHVALLGDAVSDYAFELGRKRQHGAVNFADRGEVVVGNPAPESQQLIVKDWCRIDCAQNALGGDLRFAVMRFNHDAHEALLPERNQHASADDRCDIRGHTVGEDHVQRDRQGNVAKFGHWLKDKLQLLFGAEQCLW
jgi:hypothetical protein